MKKAVLIILGVMVPPLVIHFLIILPDLSEVFKTGMCPAAPPDIPPYPCSVGDFYKRMLFGWSLLANLVIFVAWQFLLGGMIGVYLAFKKSR